MATIIEISDSKFDEMAEHAEKVMRHGKKLMECFEELCESGMGERGGYMRGGYGNREFDEEDYSREREDEMAERYYGRYGRDGMGMRRGRSMRTGRYISR